MRHYPAWDTLRSSSFPTPPPLHNRFRLFLRYIHAVVVSLSVLSFIVSGNLKIESGGDGQGVEEGGRRREGEGEMGNGRRKESYREERKRERKSLPLCHSSLYRQQAKERGRKGGGAVLSFSVCYVSRRRKRGRKGGKARGEARRACDGVAAPPWLLFHSSSRVLCTYQSFSPSLVPFLLFVLPSFPGQEVRGCRFRCGGRARYNCGTAIEKTGKYHSIFDNIYLLQKNVACIQSYLVNMY